MPQYTKSDEASVNSYLTNSENTIDYYWKTGNIKQVAMNAEVAGMSVKELVSESVRNDKKTSLNV